MTQTSYVVKTVVLSSGERLPMLVARSTGIPLHEPTLYVLSEVRAINRASNTIEHALRSIMVLQLFLDASRIDMSSRFRERQVFSLTEIDRLVQYCRQPLVREISRKIAHLTQKNALNGVAGHTAANRIRAIRDYLDWFVRYYMVRYSSHVEGVVFWKDWERCRDALNARMPRHKGRNVIGRREGLPLEIVERLLSVTSPSSSENPWKSISIRIRNNLIIRWFYELGLRRGELLNIKITDIDFRSEELIVARRADDLDDPRKDQPLVKTRDRKIPLSSALCRLTHNYITKTRQKIEGARRHPFLFVAMGTGKPLSIGAVNAIFAGLREAFRGEFDGLTPHVLRHTWNDRFSEIMDKTDIPASEEERMRSFLMGWSPSSKTAENYTRRHIRLRAQQVSLEMQAAQAESLSNDD